VLAAAKGEQQPLALTSQKLPIAQLELAAQLVWQVVPPPQPNPLGHPAVGMQAPVLSQSPAQL
jgi:hypothetical protein